MSGILGSLSGVRHHVRVRLYQACQKRQRMARKSQKRRGTSSKSQRWVGPAILAFQHFVMPRCSLAAIGLATVISALPVDKQPHPTVLSAPLIQPRHNVTMLIAQYESAALKVAKHLESVSAFFQLTPRGRIPAPLAREAHELMDSAVNTLFAGEPAS